MGLQVGSGLDLVKDLTGTVLCLRGRFGGKLLEDPGVMAIKGIQGDVGKVLVVGADRGRDNGHSRWSVGWLTIDYKP